MNASLFEDLADETETRKPRKPQTAIEQPKPDPLADALVANKLVPNTFILDLNGALTAPHDPERPYPWSLPSRLFQFPIEVTRQGADGSRTMTLRHPLLSDHPFVRQVERGMGIRIAAEDVPDYYGTWWHAVDLISSGMWPDLLKTSRFTTPEHIAGAVAFGLNYSPHEGKKRNGYISTADARKVMAAIDVPQPDDRDSIIRDHFCRPSGNKSEKGTERWPINALSHDQYAKAWGHILAIEGGWFAHDRAGFLGWTAAGRDRFPPEPRVQREVKPYVPPAPVKTASLADEIAQRPPPKRGGQLDLF